MKKQKLITSLVFSALVSMLLMQSVAFAQDAPPSLSNPFGDLVETAVDDAFPSVDLEDPVTPPETTHPAATLPKSGPESTYILMLLAVSIAGGYVLNLKTEKE